VGPALAESARRLFARTRWDFRAVDHRRADAKALIERFHVDSCPGEQLLRNPTGRSVLVMRE
jgi:hypothetical protein